MLTSTQTREKRHTYNIHGSSLTELTKSESLARKWAKKCNPAASEKREVSKIFW